MTVIFRQATIDDIDAIMKIEQESFQIGVQESKDTFLNKIITFDKGFLVAQDTETNEIGACIAGELWDKTHPLTPKTLAIGHNIADVHTPMGQMLYIETFSSLKSWRGRKIGKALFQKFQDKILKEFPNVEKSVLILSEKWVVAKSIYEKNGFKEIAQFPDFFEPENLPKENALLMEKHF